MDRGLYLATSGMLSELNRQDVIAHNLANVATPGYKNDLVGQVSFADALLNNRATGQVLGETSLGSVSRVTTNFNQGPLDRTDDPLDLAIQGTGFFRVRTPQGDFYTRNGRLSVGAGGQLVDAGGNAVLSTTGAPIAPGTSEIDVSPTGEVRAGGRLVGTLAIVDLDNPRKAGNGLVTGQAQGQSQTSLVEQGAIESSGADPTQNLIESIASLRNFESMQRVLRTLDETLGRAASIAQVGNG